MGGRGASYGGKVTFNGKTYKIPKKFAKERLAEGWDKEDVPRKYKELLQQRVQHKKYDEKRKKYGPRDITSMTYERAVKRQRKNLDKW